ncbi:ATP-binding protein, partial [Streptomyces sp. ID01-9D]|uniref:ATP-binding protein n=1 Tax=Streptomyces sp. ID01-9D TaxID=3028659 RepID=UPI0029C386EA
MPPSSPRRLSLQQIIEGQRRAAFVGREAELGLFRANFALPPEDPRHRFVFHVRGNAGVGKTSLVREWRELAGEFGALTASVDESADSVPDVLAAIAAQFAEQGYPLKALDRLLDTYRRALHDMAGRLAADNEGSGGDPSPGALAAAQAGLIAAGAIPVVGALAGGIDPAAISPA